MTDSLPSMCIYRDSCQSRNGTTHWTPKPKMSWDFNEEVTNYTEFTYQNFLSAQINLLYDKADRLDIFMGTDSL